MTEPIAARFHFVVRGLRGVHASVIGALRGYFTRAPGWVLLTTRGRKTGLPREVLLPCTRFDGTILVMSTYGERSDWMRNLRRDPRVQVTHRGHTLAARAEVVEDLQRKRALVTAHPFFAPAPFALVHVVALTILRPLVILQLRRWVRPRPVVLLHTQRVDLGPEFVSAEAVATTARAAERAGFDSVSVTDHPFPQDEWMRSGGHHALDPFVALSFAAAATSRIRLLTFIYVLTYRNPFLSAKSVASLDVLSGGRLVFGVAAGYLEPEFEALGVAFEERDDLADEALRAMKLAWSEEGVHLEGRHFVARGHTALPRPVQKPHPPIWVGGNSKRAIRRAVELADGWMPIFNPAQQASRRRTPAIESAADIRERLAYAGEVAKRAGRTTPLEVALTARGLGSFGTPKFDRDAFVADVVELRAAGATYLNCNLPAATRAEHADRIARFGEEVLPRLP